MPERALAEFFREDHRACDRCYSQLEAALDSGDAAASRTALESLVAQMQHHFSMEEQVLFPAFEAKTGMTGGPTQVMRMEHEQMRGVLGQMEAAFEKEELQRVLDLGDTLLMLIQQHNQKEEAVLYPMAESQLSAEWGDLHARIAEL